MRVIDDLDIFDKVGKGVAHDEYIPFSIKDNTFVYNNMESFINNGKIKVEFLKVRFIQNISTTFQMNVTSNFIFY